MCYSLNSLQATSADNFRFDALEYAQRDLIRYQTSMRLFEVKYGQTFMEFRDMILSSLPSAEVEQDYFDWELAFTRAEDIAQEIERLTDRQTS